jgi:hypothetical protein
MRAQIHRQAGEKAFFEDYVACVKAGVALCVWSADSAVGTRVEVGGLDLVINWCSVTSPWRPAPWQRGRVVCDSAGDTFGRVDWRRPCVARLARSLMAENGVIFSDSVESDFLEFTSGVTATISVADRVGQLVH